MTFFNTFLELVRASATETDVTVALSHRAQDIRKSYVPLRERVPREARPKILRTTKGKGTARSATLSYVHDLYRTVPREARQQNLRRYLLRRERASRFGDE